MRGKYILGRYVDEDEMDEYQREDREERVRARAEERHRREPPIREAPEECEHCGGKGQVQVLTEDDDYDSDGCSHCRGTGVQP